MRIAVLALQGAFIEHEQMLSRLGVEVFEVRQLADWLQPKDGLIIPGGESTTMTKLLYELGLFDPVKQAIEAGWMVSSMVVSAPSTMTGTMPASPNMA